MDVGGNPKKHEEVVHDSVKGNNNVMWSLSHVLLRREASFLLMYQNGSLMLMYSGFCLANTSLGNLIATKEGIYEGALYLLGWSLLPPFALSTSY